MIRKNPRAAKMPLKALPGALVAHDRIQAISDEIRTRHGLQLVAESDFVAAWRARLAPTASKATTAGPIDELALRRKLAGARAQVTRLENQLAAA
jgi:hypothetical protein